MNDIHSKKIIPCFTFTGLTNPPSHCYPRDLILEEGYWITMVTRSSEHEKFEIFDALTATLHLENRSSKSSTNCCSLAVVGLFCPRQYGCFLCVLAKLSARRFGHVIAENHIQ